MDVISIGIQICSGMMHCIERYRSMGKEFIHHDIKPSNILINKDKTVKIIDFGISGSKSIGLKTEDYALPEQKDNKPTSEKSDIYNTGITLCEIYRQIKSEDGELAEVNSLFTEIIRDCLFNDPNDRIASFHLLKNRLLEIYNTTSCDLQPFVPYNSDPIKKTLFDDPIAAFMNININKPANINKESFKSATVFGNFTLSDLGNNGRAEALYYNAEHSRSNENYSEALKYYSQCIKADVQNSKHWYRWGTLLQQLKYFKEAAAKFLQSFLLDNKNYSALSKLIDLYLYIYDQKHIPEVAMIINAILSKFSKFNYNNIENKLIGALYYINNDYNSAKIEFYHYLSICEEDMCVQYFLNVCEAKSIHTTNTIHINILDAITYFKKCKCISATFDDINYIPYKPVAIMSQLLRYQIKVSNGFSDEEMELFEQDWKAKEERRSSQLPEFYCPELTLLIKIENEGNKDIVQCLNLIFSGSLIFNDILSFTPKVNLKKATVFNI